MVCIENKQVRDLVAQLNAQIMNADIDPFYGAGVVVVVFADTRVNTYRDDGNLVIGNLLNAANALGVDSCYIYRAREVFKTPKGKELMKEWGLSEDYEGIGNVILGYGKPEGKKEAAMSNARTMIVDGSLPLSKIAKFSGLSIGEVESIRKSIKV